MKILRITLNNLNSLRGTHEIDLEADPLGSAGIFAITGPTGAGKSTILDAITLALYGRAARYGTAPNPEHMMSRHTGFCSAAVLFEVATGRFRAEWQLRRSRNNPTGNLQAAKRYVYDDEGKVLADQTRAVEAKIEELCGLDYDRFMRSVLLAQGEFARFLKAKANERAELLESLTGTTIYSELGTLAWQEAQRRKSELETKQAQYGLIEFLTDEDRTTRQATLTTNSDRQRLLTHQRDLLTVRLNTADELQLLKDQADKVQQEQTLNVQRQQDSAADFLALDNHYRTDPFLTLLKQVDDAGRLQEQRTKLLQDAGTRLAEVEKEQIRSVISAVRLGQQMLKDRESTQATRKQALSELDKERKATDRWLREHESDAALSRSYPRIVEALNELRNIRRELTVYLDDVSKLHREISGEKRRQEDLSRAEATAAQHHKARTEQRQRAQAKLDGLLAGQDPAVLQQQFRSLQERQSELKLAVQQHAVQQELDRRLQLIRLEQQSLSKQLQDTQSEGEQLSKDTQRAEELVRALHEHLRTAQVVASLEQHRAQLTEGEPCPLCGSTEHPWASADGGAPELDGILKRLKQAEDDHRRCSAALDECRRKEERCRASLQAEARREFDTSTEISKLVANLRSVSERLGLVSDNSEPFGDALLQMAATKTESELNVLNERLAAIEKAREELARAKDSEFEGERNLQRAKDQLATCLDEIRRRQDGITETESRIQKGQEKAETLETKITSMLQPFGESLPEDGAEEKVSTTLGKRRTAFDERSQKAARLELNRKDAESALTDAEEAVKEVREGLDLFRQRQKQLRISDADLVTETSTQRWLSLRAAEDVLNQKDREVAEARGRRDERQTALEESSRDVRRLEEELQTSLASSPFVTIQNLRTSVVDHIRVEQLEARREALEQDRVQLAERLRTLQESIARLRQGEPEEGATLEEMRQQRNRLNSEIESLIGESATIQDELRRDDDNRRKVADFMATLEKEVQSLKTWEKLSGLIGSADGSRFRRFAQGISLDVLVRHANSHLGRLSDRYQLHRVEESELELEIIDLFQAGVSRPMSSLSGGESFLASLALALGLSDLAGRNVQINSLFIDEGFGSLDPETLDIALSALEVLRLDNKTIGVISHVQLLKERIGTQINVVRQPGGVSELCVTSG